MDLSMYLEATRRFNAQTSIVAKHQLADGVEVVSTGMFAGTHGIYSSSLLDLPHPSVRPTLWLRDPKTRDLSAIVPVSSLTEIVYERPTAEDNVETKVIQTVNTYLNRLVEPPSIRVILAARLHRFISTLKNKFKPRQRS